MITRAILVFLAAAVAVPQTAQADKPAPFPVFDAKRIKPPGAKTAAVPKPGKRRITVQIDPDEQAAILAARPPMDDAAPSVSTDDAPAKSAKPARTEAYSWFWETVSPTIDGAGPDRLAAALIEMAARG